MIVFRERSLTTAAFAGLGVVLAEVAHSELTESRAAAGGEAEGLWEKWSERLSLYSIFSFCFAFTGFYLHLLLPLLLVLCPTLYLANELAGEKKEEDDKMQGDASDPP
eukprot:scaffold725_cov162-Ochromonas_danica.AAC.32